MGLTEQIARIVTRTRWSSLGKPVVDRTLAAIKDGIAVAVAGASEAPVRILAQHVKKLGGNAKSTVWVHGIRTTPVQAALVNGVAIHVLDFEPMWSPPTHSVSPTVPVAFALAEMLKPAGRDIITAVAKGMEIQGRIQYAGDQYEPEHLRFHPPGVAGVMGATVTAAHLLGLDALELRHAMGIAASRAGSLLGNVGSMVKSTHCGNAAAAGLDAALLASEGFRANPDIFEAHKGFVSSFFPERFDVDRFLAFGKPWRVVDPGLAIKLFPSQFGTHWVATAALDLRAKVGDPARIKAVRIVSPVMKYVDRPKPATGLDGKFSFQYLAASGLLDGKVGIDSFTDKRRFARDMEAMLARITVKQDASIPGDWQHMRVEMTADLADGTTASVVCRGPKGSWGLPPLLPGDHAAKLHDCLSRRLPMQQVGQLLGLVDALVENRTDTAGKIVRLIAKPSKRG